MDDKLPESWRRSLSNDAKRKKPVEREPVQPEFKLRHALISALNPLVWLGVWALLARALKLDILGAVVDSPVVPGIVVCNAWMISRELSDESSHLALAGWSALCAGVCLVVFRFEGLAELYFVLLAAFIASRFIGRIGYLALVFMGLVFFTAILLLPALIYFFKNVSVSTTLNEDARLSLRLATAYSLSHAFCTGSMPAERTYFGRIDAAFSGVFSSTLGLFSGVVVFRTVLQAIQLIAELKGVQPNSLMTLSAAACGVAVGNLICVRSLFGTAYSSRAIEVASKLPAIGAADPDAIDRVAPDLNSPLHKYKPRRSIDANHFDDAT